MQHLPDLEQPKNTEIPLGHDAITLSQAQNQDVQTILKILNHRKIIDDTSGQIQQTLDTPEEQLIALEDEVKAIAVKITVLDKGTGLHGQNVAKIALKIAEEMGLSERQCKIVELAALVHDIGKMNPEILRLIRKKGRLSPEERRKVEEHTVLGYEALKKLGFPEEIARGALVHQQLLDGSQYPSQVKGKDLTIMDQILAVADKYEALRADRPYSPSNSRLQTLGKIRRIWLEKGQIDKKVFDTLQKIAAPLDTNKKEFERAIQQRAQELEKNTQEIPPKKLNELEYVIISYVIIGYVEALPPEKKTRYTKILLQARETLQAIDDSYKDKRLKPEIEKQGKSLVKEIMRLRPEDEQQQYAQAA